MRIDGLTPKPAGQGTPAADREALPVAVGDTVDAEVVSSGDGRLTLKTADGAVVSARAETPLSVLPGDWLRLSVTGRSGGLLTVALTDCPPTPQAALRQLGIGQTAAHLRLASALVASALPVSAATWDKLTRALSAFPALTPEQAVFMLAHQVPISRQNIILFNRLSSQEAQLGNQLTQLASLLAGIPDPAPTAAGHPRQAAPSAPSLLTADPPPGQTTSLAAPPQTTPIWPGPPDSASVLPPAPPTEPQTSATAVSPAPQGETRSAGPPVSAPGVTDAAAPEPQTPAPPAGPEGKSPPSAQGPAPASSRETPPGQRRESVGPAGEDSPPAVGGPSAATHLSAPPQDKAAVASLREMIGPLFKAVREQQSDSLPKELGAVKLARDVAELLHAVSETAASLPQAQREAALTLVRDIADGIKFAQQLQHFATVVQLPVDVNGHKATAELYVFKDGKHKKKIDPQSATLFLSLATAHLGRVETLVKVIGNNIECDFKLEEADWADEARAQAGVLRALLEQGGFRLTRSSFAQDSPTTGPIAVGEAREQHARRYSFEARA